MTDEELEKLHDEFRSMQENVAKSISHRKLEKTKSPETG
jgi:hypothetical protein